MWEGPLPIIPPGGFFRMKRGKKYQDAVKKIEKGKLYSINEASELVKTFKNNSVTAQQISVMFRP